MTDEHLLFKTSSRFRFGGFRPQPGFTSFAGATDDFCNSKCMLSPDFCSTGSSDFDRADSPVPSRMLAHEAQVLGFRERAELFAVMGSPQQMQTMGFTFRHTRRGSGLLQEKNYGVLFTSNSPTAEHGYFTRMVGRAILCAPPNRPRRAEDYAPYLAACRPFHCGAQYSGEEMRGARCQASGWALDFSMGQARGHGINNQEQQ